MQYNARRAIGQDIAPIEADQFAVLDFLEPSTSSIIPACRRTALSEYLDGTKGITCDNLASLLSSSVITTDILACDLCITRKAHSGLAQSPLNVSAVVTSIESQKEVNSVQSKTSEKTSLSKTEYQLPHQVSRTKGSLIHRTSSIVPTPTRPLYKTQSTLERSLNKSITSMASSNSTATNNSFRQVQEKLNEALFKEDRFSSAIKTTSNFNQLFDIVDAIESKIYGPGYCSACYVLQLASDRDITSLQHDAIRSEGALCVEVYNLNMAHFVTSIRSVIKFIDFGCCWTCRFPQFICSGGDRSGNKGFTGSCTKPYLRDVLFLPVYLFWQIGIQNDGQGWRRYNDKLANLFEQIIELHTTNDAQFMAFLAKAYKISFGLTINMLWVLCKLHRIFWRKTHIYYGEELFPHATFVDFRDSK